MKKLLYTSIFTAIYSLCLAAPQNGQIVPNGEDVSSLVQNSPFIPGFSSSSSGSSTNVQNLELKGILKFNDSVRFSIHDKSTKKSVWISTEEKNSQFEIKDYDPEKQTVSIVAGGRLVELSLSAPAASTSAMQQLPQSSNFSMNLGGSQLPQNFGKSSSTLPQSYSTQRPAGLSNQPIKTIPKTLEKPSIPSSFANDIFDDFDDDDDF